MPRRGRSRLSSRGRASTASGTPSRRERRAAACARSSRSRRALDGAAGWITGLRAGQSAASRRRRPSSERDAGHRLIKINPLADWSRADVERYVAENAVPYNPLHDRGYLSIGCAPCTRAVRVGEPERAGRWWWEEEAKKECGLHLQAEPQRRRRAARRSGRMSAALRRADAQAPAHPSSAPRGREHPHPARGGGGGREPGLALLDRQGFLGSSAPGAQGLRSRPPAVPAPACRLDLEVPRDDRVPRSSGARARPRPFRAHQRGGAGPAASVRSRTAPSVHTDVMKTQALRQALDRHRFDAAIGGARRDEEASSAKERVVSVRNAHHRWDPKSQRAEPWRLYNLRKAQGESLRVFPLSNWTELDVWLYIHQERIPVVPLYFAAERPVVERDGPADHGRRRAPAAPSGGEAAAALGPLPDARLLPAHRRHRERGVDVAGRHPRDARVAHIRAAGPAHRQGRRRPPWSARSRKGISDGCGATVRPGGLRRRSSRGSRKRMCCASSPAARSTTASRL